MRIFYACLPARQPARLSCGTVSLARAAVPGGWLVGVALSPFLSPARHSQSVFTTTTKLNEAIEVESQPKVSRRSAFSNLMYRSPCWQRRRTARHRGKWLLRTFRRRPSERRKGSWPGRRSTLPLRPSVESGPCRSFSKQRSVRFPWLGFVSCVHSFSVIFVSTNGFDRASERANSPRIAP